MKRAFVIIAGLIFLTGCQTVLKSEPKKGTLGFGKKVLVDDGSCPAGQIKQVTGGNKSISRKYECIANPN